MSHWRELNPRPTPYQGVAIPLSHSGIGWSQYIKVLYLKISGNGHRSSLVCIWRHQLLSIQPNFDIMSIDECQSEASPNIERLGSY